MPINHSVSLRPLGDSKLSVSPVCLGGNVFGWTIGESESFAVLDAFIGAGFNFIDTADVYSAWKPGNQGGESETIIGQWLRRRGGRQNVVIATKVGAPLAPDKKGLSKAYILRAAEDSLRRLQTDYIDLYQSHVDDATTPLQETLEAYALLIDQGKVRAIGASNYSGSRLAEALRISEDTGQPRYSTLQPHYNLYERAGFEGDQGPICRENNIAVIPYYALASGFLTGKYRSESDLGQSARGQGVKRFLNPRGFRILDALDKVSGEYASTPAKVALAWLMAQPGITAPIASATSVAQVKELIESADVRLDSTALSLLGEASRPE
ncbi:MAG TPA: aldo/keto reductase [Bryobacteraceae bacterium]|nr:aldo/keto reductase [Bryobacteraceae bacterium]